MLSWADKHAKFAKTFLGGSNSVFLFDTMKHQVLQNWNGHVEVISVTAAALSGETGLAARTRKVANALSTMKSNKQFYTDVGCCLLKSTFDADAVKAVIDQVLDPILNDVQGIESQLKEDFGKSVVAAKQQQELYLRVLDLEAESVISVWKTNAMIFRKKDANTISVLKNALEEEQQKSKSLEERLLVAEARVQSLSEEKAAVAGSLMGHLDAIKSLLQSSETMGKMGARCSSSSTNTN